MRQICLSRYHFAGISFLLETVINPWGEDDPIAGAPFRGGYEDEASLALWSYLCGRTKPGDLVLDVGAYAGLFSLIAARLRPNSQTVAFEASVITLGRLMRNIIINGNELAICPANFAAWHQDEVLEFKHSYGIYTPNPGDSVHGKDSEPEFTEKVWALPLDRLLDRSTRLPGALGARATGLRPFNRIALMKVDVERAEDHVLRGAATIIQTMRPHLICEALSEAAVERLKARMAPYDYRIRRIGDEYNYHLAPNEECAGFDTGFADWSAAHAGQLNLTGERYISIDISREIRR